MGIKKFTNRKSHFEPVRNGNLLLAGKSIDSKWDTADSIVVYKNLPSCTVKLNYVKNILQKFLSSTFLNIKN